MDLPGKQGWSDRLLRLAFTMVAAALLISISIHLIQSVLPELLVGLVVAGALPVVVLVIRRHRNNRYW